MPHKKDAAPSPPPPPAPADAVRQRPPELPDFVAPPGSLPEAESLLEEDPFDSPTYEPPLQGEGP